MLSTTFSGTIGWSTVGVSSSSTSSLGSGISTTEGVNPDVASCLADVSSLLLCSSAASICSWSLSNSLWVNSLSLKNISSSSHAVYTSWQSDKKNIINIIINSTATTTIAIRTCIKLNENLVSKVPPN